MSCRKQKRVNRKTEVAPLELIYRLSKNAVSAHGFNILSVLATEARFPDLLPGPATHHLKINAADVTGLAFLHCVSCFAK